MENTGPAPTGCYKCGRPGHWSRDCPSSAPNPNPNSDPNLNLYSSSKSSSFKTGGGASKPVEKSSEKPKKVPRTRPKLTPELLLSNDGLGYVLRHFPHAFKYRGRGHEFVCKVEQVGAAKRVKTCIRDLREKVANGGDPTKLHEPPTEHDGTNYEQEAVNSEEPSHHQRDLSSKNHDTDDIQEDMLHEIYTEATQEPSQTETVAADCNSIKELLNQGPDEGASCFSKIQITEEQKARIEANRLKALEKAAARACSLPAA